MLRAKLSMFDMKSSRAAAGTKMAYFTIPVRRVLREFIIMILRFKGKTLKLFEIVATFF